MDNEDRKWIAETINDKIGQLSNIFDETIAQMDARFDDKLAQMDARFDDKLAQMDAKFDDKLARMDAKFDDKLARMDAKFDDKLAQMDAKFDDKLAQMEARLIDKIEQSNDQLRKDFNTTLQRQAAVFRRNVDERIDQAEERIERKFDMIYENRILPMIKEHISVLPGAEKSYDLLEGRVKSLEDKYLMLDLIKASRL